MESPSVGQMCVSPAAGAAEGTGDRGCRTASKQTASKMIHHQTMHFPLWHKSGLFACSQP